MIVTNDLVFIHIPKTAGRSVTMAISELKDVQYHKQGVSIGYEKLPIHSRCSDVLRVMNEDYHKAFKFTIVRNPFDRLVSFYEYGNINFKYKFERFSDFILFVSGNNSFKAGLNWKTARRTQSYYIDFDIDSFGKFESINDYWLSLNLGVDLPIVNNTPHGHFLDYYTKEEIDIVKNTYKIDFINFYPELL